MKILFSLMAVFLLAGCNTQPIYQGKVVDSKTGAAISGVSVKLVDEGIEVSTDESGKFSFKVESNQERNLQLNKEGYMFVDMYHVKPSDEMKIELRAKKQSLASKRWDHYMESCENYNSPKIPDNPEWNLKFKETELTGDLVKDSKYTRRDPSAVIKVNGKYYVWYSYKLSEPSTYFKTDNLEDCVFPWDYTDVYYATSTDGYEWKEQGPAVTRGPAGSFDDRSVFTPEIFVHNDKFYLVYQVVQAPYVERVKNNVAMAVADSPDGPWTKLDEPILRPTHNGVWTEGSKSRLDADVKGDFDSHKVHDPCLMYYNNKFYLYYKGERMGEEKFCEEREIKWGVAIADKPEGPYVKSEYNPITNTGHEVSVWNYSDGIAIIQKLDGPEMGSVQFAKDGFNFEIMGKAEHVPDALGIYRSDKQVDSPKYGVSWGLAHVMDWNQIPGGWMYLTRFDLVEE